ncbi:hypothetical protein FAM19031_001144 [Propionibacterium freudenreichii]|uniref:hypothetical protein n=1 Tax=Propionibacterium freudenreichii TaxID=1744 RepID=UPI002551B6A6|nr:hypothetical protein [Propionibacterium freudenreichii]MDK9295044.1 hypothetical protein [Propionibacterium freudenreichii]MDK9360412.1 hypothetical protein [Propionibacterium freudenreichii]
MGPGESVGVDLGVEEHFEGSVVVDAELVVFVDVDLGEEGLVAEASVGVVAAFVDFGAVGEQVEGVVEVGSGVCVVAVVGVDAAVGGVEFGEDAVLFSFEDGEWDGASVVGLH